MEEKCFFVYKTKQLSRFGVAYRDVFGNGRFWASNTDILETDQITANKIERNSRSQAQLPYTVAIKSDVKCAKCAQMRAKDGLMMMRAHSILFGFILVYCFGCVFFSLPLLFYGFSFSHGIRIARQASSFDAHNLFCQPNCFFLFRLSRLQS